MYYNTSERMMIIMTEVKEGQTKGDVKGRSIRITDEDYAYFQRVSKETGVSQADLMSEFTKSHQRLQLESESVFGQSLEDLRSYSDKIIDLFTTLVNSTEDRIVNEQTKAIEAEKKYERQIVKADETKTEYVAKSKLLETQVKELTAKLEEYSNLEEMIDSRIEDKNKIIESKDKEIAVLTEKVESLRNAEKDFKKSKEINEELEKQLVNTEGHLKSTQQQLIDKGYALKDAEEGFKKSRETNEELKKQLVAAEEQLKSTQQQLIDKEHAAKEALLNQKEELQNHYNKEIQAMHDKREQAVREAEQRVFTLFQKQEDKPATQKRNAAKKSAPKPTDQS
jgi:chromosome segregation ATPase